MTFLLGKLALSIFIGYFAFKMLGVAIYAAGNLVGMIDDGLRGFIDRKRYGGKFPKL